MPINLDLMTTAVLVHASFESPARIGLRYLVIGELILLKQYASLLC